MYPELMAHSTLLALPLLALFLFIAVFVGIVMRTFRQRAAHYDDLARLPMTTEDDDE
jgi:type II secretory pathway component PulF